MIYVTKMLYFEIISFEEFILLEDISLMAFCYIFEIIYVIGRFCFYKISLNFLVSNIQDKQDS